MPTMTPKVTARYVANIVAAVNETTVKIGELTAAGEQPMAQLERSNTELQVLVGFLTGMVKQLTDVSEQRQAVDLAWVQLADSLNTQWGVICGRLSPGPVNAHPSLVGTNRG